MSERFGKRRQIYLDYPKDMSKTCLKYGPGHSLDEYKILGGFGSYYVKSNPNKDRRNNTVPKITCNRQKENNAIVNNTVDEILLHKNEQVSAMKEAHKNVGSNFDDNKIHHI